ncbi:hypothetical protein K7G98_36520 [Saccharothrix sp. MB29]|nr:hypothetical protein [Saccharothrix sp. MB29]
MALPRYGEDDLPPDAELPVVDGPGHPLPDAVHRVGGGGGGGAPRPPPRGGGRGGTA